MRLRTAAIPAAALSALLAAACSSAPPAARQPSMPSSPAPSSPPAATAPAKPAAAVVHGNITIAAPGSLAPGPMKITPVYCGKLSSAQKQQFGTNADGGLIFKYDNVSNSMTASPDLEVNFTQAGSVAGANVAGDPAMIGPGQSATSEVDALNQGGGDVTFSGCEVMSYTLTTQAGMVAGEYAG